MSDTSGGDAPHLDPDRLRQDIVYAAAVLDAAKTIEPPAPAPGILLRVFRFFSSALGLLLLGSLITSLLIPAYQRASEQREAERSIMRDSLAEFLQYEVSIWREYYAVFPLIHESEIDRATYDKFTDTISEIKLDRYRAYGKVKALAIAFRDDGVDRFGIEKAIRDFAIELNETSQKIDDWLGALYCARALCAELESRSVNSKAVLDELEGVMQEITRHADAISERMVQRIQGHAVAAVDSEKEGAGGPEDSGAGPAKQ